MLEGLARAVPRGQAVELCFPIRAIRIRRRRGHLHRATTGYGVRPDVPIGSWKVAWTNAREVAGVKCRWHDLRHTFVSKLGEALVSDTTITAMARWMSRK